jgi:NAD-reducing hydrogenase large subunit
MNRALDADDRDGLTRRIGEAIETTRAGIAVILDYYAKNEQFVRTFAAFPSNYMALVTPEGNLEHYDGLLRMIGPDGTRLEDFYDPSAYLSFIAEATEEWSYLKFPFYRPQGYPEGAYRVGPLARLNACDAAGTPEAQKELDVFRSIGGGKPVEGSLYYHYARLVEILFCIERVQQLLAHPDICGQELIAESYRILPEGVGVIEAPRGTLFHHYVVDEGGAIERVNLIVASGQNNYAMNQSVTEVAKMYVKANGHGIEEGMLNKVEAAIRAYDPCLSCSTHAVGQMPLVVETIDSQGQLIERKTRNAE